MTSKGFSLWACVILKGAFYNDFIFFIFRRGNLLVWGGLLGVCHIATTSSVSFIFLIFSFSEGEIETIGRLRKAGKATPAKPSTLHFIGANAREEDQLQNAEGKEIGLVEWEGRNRKLLVFRLGGASYCPS